MRLRMSRPWEAFRSSRVFADQTSNGETLRKELEKRSVDVENIVVDPGHTTTTKVRVLAGQHYAPRQQVIRIDYENTISLGTN